MLKDVFHLWCLGPKIQVGWEKIRAGSKGPLVSNIQTLGGVEVFSEMISNVKHLYRCSMMWSSVLIRSLPSLGRSYEVFGPSCCVVGHSNRRVFHQYNSKLGSLKSLGAFLLRIAMFFFFRRGSHRFEAGLVDPSRMVAICVFKKHTVWFYRQYMTIYCTRHMSSIGHILPHIRIFILLMEEILHHLGCINKHPANHEINYLFLNWCVSAGFLVAINSTLYPHHLNLQNLLGSILPGPFPLASTEPSPHTFWPRWGPFLCRFDADDVMHKERLEHQLEVLRNLSLCQKAFFFDVQVFFRVFPSWNFPI